MSIHLEQVCKTFYLSGGRQLSVLKNISVSVQTRDFLIILGESGCGKSTLLNLLAGLIRASSGVIRVNESIVTGPHPSRSIIFQQPSLLPWLTVEENILFGCRLRGDLKNLEFRAQLLIDVMGLAGFEKIHPAELSLGMAQRVCLARAFIGHPEILLLDEPFAALDTFNRTHLQQELLDFQRIEGFTAVFVTHDIDEALLLGNKIILLGDRPSRIIDSFKIPLGYPRDPTDETFFQIRNRILKKLKQAMVTYQTFEV